MCRDCGKNELHHMVDVRDTRKSGSVARFDDVTMPEADRLIEGWLLEPGHVIGRTDWYPGECCASGRCEVCCPGYEW